LKQNLSPYQKPDRVDGGEPGEPKLRLSVMALSSLIYGAMSLTALLIMWFWHANITSSFVPPQDPKEIARLAGIGLLAAGVLLIASHLFEDWFRSYRRLRNLIMRLLGGISAPGAIYLAMLSAIGEELLFRGAIQPFAGLFLTSIMFGLLHVGPDGKISAWSFWTMLAGLLLGYMYEQTGSLMAPMLTHFAVNTYSLLRLRRLYGRFLDGVEVQLGKDSSAEADATPGKKADPDLKN